MSISVLLPLTAPLSPWNVESHHQQGNIAGVLNGTVCNDKGGAGRNTLLFKHRQIHTAGLRASVIQRMLGQEESDKEGPGLSVRWWWHSAL